MPTICVYTEFYMPISIDYLALDIQLKDTEATALVPFFCCSMYCLCVNV